jgi:SAM-dependent methyltransferase
VGVIEAPVNTPAAWSERAARCAEPWEACGWSEEGQRARFESVLWALDPRPRDCLLDFGCGTGELASLLADEVRYYGYDTAPGMIDRALEQHGQPERLFSIHWPHGHFDLVACVGPFNLPDNWSKERTWHTLRHLWDTTGCRTLAVSLYAGDDGKCLRYTEAEAERCARQLSWDSRVERILPNDLLLTVRR